jgi:hypothetical protein
MGMDDPDNMRGVKIMNWNELPMTESDRNELDNMTVEKALMLVKFALRDNLNIKNVVFHNDASRFTLIEAIDAAIENTTSK